MINDTFITSTCTALSVAIPPVLIPPTRPPFTVAPSATPTIAPTTTPIATVAPTAAATAVATATPTVAFTPAPVIAGVQSLPSTSTDEQLSPLLILALALGAIGVLMLLRRPIRHL
jgi:LPXTG-motif cell wall-anchored protein